METTTIKVTANQRVLGLEAEQTVEVEDTEFIRAHIESGHLRKERASAEVDEGAVVTTTAAVTEDSQRVAEDTAPKAAKR